MLGRKPGVSKIAKHWQDSGMWEFYDLDDEFGKEQLEQGRAHLVDDEIAEEYEALVDRLVVLGRKVWDQK